MAGIDMSKELIFHSVGKGYMETVTGKIVEIIKGMSMKFDVKATLVDVEGGDSLFPIYTFISKKEGTIEVNSAVFTLGQTGIGQGVTYTNTGNLKNSRILATLATTSLGTALTGVTNVKVLAADGTSLAVSSTGTAAATSGIDVDATGDIIWGATVPAGEYAIWFRSDSATATKAGLLKNAMPEVCSFSWMLPAEELDGSVYQVDVFAKRVRADGSYMLDGEKGKASTPKLTLKLLDPGDGTDDFATIIVSKIS